MRKIHILTTYTRGNSEDSFQIQEAEYFQRRKLTRYASSHNFEDYCLQPR